MKKVEDEFGDDEQTVDDVENDDEEKDRLAVDPVLTRPPESVEEYSGLVSVGLTWTVKLSLTHKPWN